MSEFGLYYEWCCLFINIRTLTVDDVGYLMRIPRKTVEGNRLVIWETGSHVCCCVEARVSSEERLPFDILGEDGYGVQVDQSPQNVGSDRVLIAA